MTLTKALLPHPRTLSRLVLPTHPVIRPLTTTPPRPRIYDSIRNPTDLSTLLLTSPTLLTLWTASYCRTCRTVAPLLRDVLENPAPGSPLADPDLPPVGYAELEIDAPDMGEVAARYGVRGVPMLLAFGKGEPRTESVVVDAGRIARREFLEEWVMTEARKGGGGGGLFGGLFGR